MACHRFVRTAQALQQTGVIGLDARVTPRGVRFLRYSLPSAAIATASAITVNLITTEGTTETPLLFWSLVVLLLVSVIGSAALETRLAVRRHVRVRQPLPTANPWFTDRAVELASLAHGVPARRGEFELAVHVISGPDGVGKTQLAIRHLLNCRDAVAVDWFLDGNDAEAQLFAARADLGFPEATSVAALRTLLEEHDKRWMIVFDDVAAWEQIARVLPERGRGQVIVTSPAERWERPVGVRETRLRELDETSAVDHLQERTGDSDAAAATALARALGCFPLALEQASSYINALPGQSLRRYVDRLKTDAPELFRSGRPVDHRHTVATVWLSAMKQLETDTPRSAALLRCLSYFGDEEIPLRWFVGPDLPDQIGGGDRDRVGLALYGLAQFSLVDHVRRRNALRVHRLIRQVTHLGGSAAERQGRVHAAHVLRGALYGEPDDRRGGALHAAALLKALEPVPLGELLDPREQPRLIAEVALRAGLEARAQRRVGAARDLLLAASCLAAPTITLGALFSDAEAEESDQATRTLGSVLRRQLPPRSTGVYHTLTLLKGSSTFREAQQPTSLPLVNDTAVVLNVAGEPWLAHNLLEAAYWLNQATAVPDRDWCTLLVNLGAAMAEFAEAVLDGAQPQDHLDPDLEHLPDDWRDQVRRHPQDPYLIAAASAQVLGRKQIESSALVRMLRRHAYACFADAASRTLGVPDLAGIHRTAQQNLSQLRYGNDGDGSSPSAR
jgi:hypothetical protein